MVVKTMNDFFTRLHTFINARMEIHDQLDELKEYKKIMGHRYVFRGRTLPMSIFAGEGLALYLFVKMFEPRLILDLFTGTGFSAAHLAAGCPSAWIYSADNYSEGDVGDSGWQESNDLINACQLTNVKLIRGSHMELMAALDADGHMRDELDMLFLDGPGKNISRVFQDENMVVVTHDDQALLGPNDFRLMGGSHLTFTVLPEMLPICYDIFSPHFTIGVSDAISWKPSIAPEQLITSW